MLSTSLFKWFVTDLFGLQSNPPKPKPPVVVYSGEDCFEDRICDDLAEDIIKWLPIDDKIRFRAVSNQFRYCLDNVLRRQRLFKVDKDRIDVNNLTRGRRRYDVRSRPLLGLHAADELLHALAPVKVSGLDRYLSLCPNTTGFHCGKFTYIADKERVLEAIIQKCSYLESLTFDFRECPQPLIDQFTDKFAKGLKRLEICQTAFEMPPNVHSVLQKCSNLNALVNIDFDCLFDHNDQILVKNLIRVKANNVNNKRRFRTFVKNNPNLKRLWIGLSYGAPSEDFSDFLFQISKLQSLVFLELNICDFPLYDRSLIHNMTAVAKNCLQLKYFAFRIDPVTTFDLSHFFQSFKPFSGLRRLCIEIKAEVPLKTGFLDVKYIKNNRDLTHLDIFYDKIDDEFFQGIHVLFPKLRNINIKMRHHLTDEAMVSFGKLKRLEILIIERNERRDLKTITDLGFLSLLNGCRRLILFEVHNPIKITENAMLAMIRKAVRYPNMKFKYYIEQIEDQFELSRYSDNQWKLPKNLVVMGASYYQRY